MDQNKSSIGSIIGTIIIIALIILGGLYFWGKQVEERKLNQSAMREEEPSTTTLPEQNEAAIIKSMGTSDDLDSIDSDLQKTNLNNLDAELNQ